VLWARGRNGLKKSNKKARSINNQQQNTEEQHLQPPCLIIETMAAEKVDEPEKAGESGEIASAPAAAAVSKKPTTTRRAPASHRIHEKSSRAAAKSNSTSNNGGGEPGAAPAVRKRPSVRFDESTVIKNKSDKRKNDPRKIYMGKMSKVKVCMHFSLPIVAIAILLFFSMEFDPTKNSSKGKGKKQTAKEALTQLMQLKAQEVMGRRRKDPCALFLHTGSIPGTGWSFFAGQHYQKGDLLMESTSSSSSSPLVLGIGDGSSSSSIQVPPYALVLKHHPALANAGGPLYTTTTPSTNEDASELSPSSFQLRATRSIAVGEEIFVRYDPVLHGHPQDDNNNSPTSILFDHVPLESEYSLADGIILDMLTTSRGHKKKTNSGIVFQLLKRSIAKFNRRVAALIPENVQLAQGYNTNLPSYWEALRNRTLTSLQDAAAVCVSDVVVVQQQQQGDNNGGGAVWTIQRNVKKGDVLATVPIHVQLVSSISNTSRDSCTEADGKVSSSEECSASLSLLTHQNCFGHSILPVCFCPLTNVVPLRSKDGDDDDDANVEYRWKESKMHKMSLRKLFDPSNKAAWDLVALKDLSAGEVVSTAEQCSRSATRYLLFYCDFVSFL